MSFRSVVDVSGIIDVSPYCGPQDAGRLETNRPNPTAAVRSLALHDDYCILPGFKPVEIRIDSCLARVLRATVGKHLTTQMIHLFIVPFAIAFPVSDLSAEMNFTPFFAVLQG